MLQKSRFGLVKMKFYFEDQDFKEKFVCLTQELETNNLLCTVEKEGYRHMVVVSKLPKQKKRKWLSKILDTKNYVCCNCCNGVN